MTARIATIAYLGLKGLGRALRASVLRHLRNGMSERDLMDLALAEARKSRDEGDGRIHPKVGVVVVKDGRVLAKAHRGEQELGEHAEYIALEKKLRDSDLSGAHVYTTLEPCTSRNDPKLPCAKRLLERRIDRVVIGILDPNPEIRGSGELLLQKHKVEIGRFDGNIANSIIDLNRDFIRDQERRKSDAGKSAPEISSELKVLLGDICRIAGDPVRRLSVVGEYFERYGIATITLDRYRDGRVDQLDAFAVQNFLAIVVSYWRSSGLVIFLGPSAREVALTDDRMGCGVAGTKVVAQKWGSPSAVLIAKILAIVGTGTYAQALKYYAVHNGRVILSLEKPYYEVNSGWGAFAEPIVTFKQKNDYAVNSDGLLEIFTRGAVIAGDLKASASRVLPGERYRWDPRTERFQQIAGRDVHGKYLLTEVYGDLGGATGDWFRAPVEIEEGRDLIESLTEQW